MTTLNKFLTVLAMALVCTSAQAKFSFSDGLERATPESQGVRSEDIASFFKSLDEGGYEVHSIMILRHDKVIAEHWWAPFSPEYTHAMYSSTKTYSAAAIGFAVQEGLININKRFMDYFPELVPAKHSPELERLTVFHVLSMSAGHANANYTGSGDEQVRSFMEKDYAYEPGTHFEYNITCSHMLSQLISRVTGETIYEYLKPRLFEPLGLSDDIFWEMDLSGRNMGNGGMHSRTSDMAKFGTFLKNKGKWNGKQLLSEEWVELMTTPHIYQHPERSNEENANDDGSQGYGFQTWMGRHGSYRAIGASNQVILVVPGSDVVVASQGSIGDENGFNTLVYKLCDTMSDKKLKENKNFDLQSEIGKYALKTPFQSSGEAQITGKTLRYKMHQNAYGIDVVDFRFDKEGNFYLTLENAASTTNIPFGYNGWKMGMTDRKMPFGRAVYTNLMGVTPYKTAGTFAWTGKNEISAYYLSMFNVSINETFVFSMNDGALTMTIKVPAPRVVTPNSRTGAAGADIVLTGSLITSSVKTTPFF